MTNEEAVKRLETLIDFSDVLDIIALEMAIKALEQQPSEDCISREVVKDMLTAEWTKYMPMELDINLSFVLDKISALPSVTPQPCEGMRDATEEERKSTKDYIDSISKPTGLQFDDIYEELDVIQPHKKISVNLQLCEDAVSRESVIEWLKDKDIIKTKKQEENARRELAELPSVTPSYNSVKTELKSSDDCISREDVMRILKTLYNFDDLKDLKVKQQEVMNLPSVTPTRPHGEWIYVQYDGNKNIGNWHCSNCRQICIAMHSMDDAFDFCPNCGADMREGDKE